MLDSSEVPNLFGVPCGVDFAQSIVNGLLARTPDPETLARTTIYANSGRMKKRLQELFLERGALLLPKLRLVMEIGSDLPHLDPAPSSLRQRLELTQMVTRLLDEQPDLAGREAIFDLADSLARLMDEMQGEDVSPEDIANLDVTDQSGHWQRAQAFLSIVSDYFDNNENSPNAEARQRIVANMLAADWNDAPPKDPILVVGSTGSRGATHALMASIARQPNCAVVVPGFDTDMPSRVWDSLDAALVSEDHPQYRYKALLDTLEMTPDQVQVWDDTPVPHPSRNALVSLALRPAPVTDQWLEDGPQLRDLDQACKNITLINAPSGRSEALTIATRLRMAAENGETAALVTPDRNLTRQVSAALKRWDIIPDDSAGLPLHLTAPGRIFRQIGALLGQKLTAEALLSILKHPLVHSADGRNAHLLRTRRLELYIRRSGMPFPSGPALQEWASKEQNDDGVMLWAHWLVSTLCPLEHTGVSSLSAHVSQHVRTTEQICAGPGNNGSGGLWDENAGRAAKATLDELVEEAPHAGDMSATDYTSLFRTILGKGEVRNPDLPHPRILIWGTLEARVLSADVVILAGLNDGVWPQAPKPDAWLNRRMRHDAGLLLPERQIGLSAHDFQMAMGAKEIWISRAIRNSEAETVPSRWVNRLFNLLGGLKAQNGPALISSMARRGDHWLALAATLDEPTQRFPAATRPSPRPPVEHRPKGLAVTRLETLVRDPYAIYAQYILGLRELSPVAQTPNAPLRGSVIHTVFERFIKEWRDEPAADSFDRLMTTAEEVFASEVPWPTAQRLWLSKLRRIAHQFIADETKRRAIAKPQFFEKTGSKQLNGIDFEIKGTVDRIDVAADGAIYLYDYKTGKPPSDDVQKNFNRQLLLEAAMVENGAFKDLGRGNVRDAVYIGLGSSPENKRAPLDALPAQVVWDQLHERVRAFSDREQGYTSRRAMQKMSYAYGFDHLARYGEWDQADEADPEDVG